MWDPYQEVNPPFLTRSDIGWLYAVLIPWTVFAGLFVLIGFIWIIASLIVNCLSAICCANRNKDQASKSTCCRNFFILLFSVALLGLAVFSVMSLNNIKNRTFDSLDSISNTFQGLETNANTVYYNIPDPYQSDFKEIRDGISWASSIQEYVPDRKSNFNDSLYALSGLEAFLGVLIVILLLGAFCGVTCLGRVFCILGGLPLIYIALLSVMIPTALITHRACERTESLFGLQSSPNHTIDTNILLLLQCAEGTLSEEIITESGLGDVLSYFQSSIQTQTNNVNKQLPPNYRLSSSWVYSVGLGNYSIVSYSQAVITSFLEQVSSVNATQSRPVQAQLTQLYNQANVFYSFVSMTNCNITQDLWSSLDENICSQSVRYGFAFGISSGLSALLLFILLIITAATMHHFSSHKGSHPQHSKVEEGTEQQPLLSSNEPVLPPSRVTQMTSPVQQSVAYVYEIQTASAPPPPAYVPSVSLGYGPLYPQIQQQQQPPPYQSYQQQ